MVLRSRLKWWQRTLYSWPALALLVLVSILLVRGTWSMYTKYRDAKERTQVAASELAAVQERKVLLQGQLERIKTSNGVEEELRHKFDVAREGEHLVVIVDKEVTPETPTSTPTLWQRVKGFLRL